MTRTTAYGLYWQQTPHPAWCTRPHHDDEGVGERHHEHHVGDLHPSLIDGHDAAGPTGQMFSAPLLSVNVLREEREIEPRVYMTLEAADDDRNFLLDLTLTEAAAVRNLLDEAITTANTDQATAVVAAVGTDAETG